MQVGALSFRPYIYNTNILSGSSLFKISSIGDDLLNTKTDYSALTDESLNVNPLKKGQTANFVDILEMQMQMGKMNASRIMKPDEQEAIQMTDDVAAEELEPISNDKAMQNMQFDRNLFMMQRAAEAYRVNMIA